MPAMLANFERRYANALIERKISSSGRFPPLMQHASKRRTVSADFRAMLVAVGRPRLCSARSAQHYATAASCAGDFRPFEIAILSQRWVASANYFAQPKLGG
jgi:hypothetical protein